MSASCRAASTVIFSMVMLFLPLPVYHSTNRDGASNRSSKVRCSARGGPPGFWAGRVETPPRHEVIALCLRSYIVGRCDRPYLSVAATALCLVGRCDRAYLSVAATGLHLSVATTGLLVGDHAGNLRIPPVREEHHSPTSISSAASAAGPPATSARRSSLSGLICLAPAVSPPLLRCVHRTQQSALPRRLSARRTGLTEKPASSANVLRLARMPRPSVRAYARP